MKNKNLERLFFTIKLDSAIIEFKDNTFLADEDSRNVKYCDYLVTLTQKYVHADDRDIVIDKLGISALRHAPGNFAIKFRAKPPLETRYKWYVLNIMTSGDKQLAFGVINLLNTAASLPGKHSMSAGFVNNFTDKQSVTAVIAACFAIMLALLIVFNFYVSALEKMIDKESHTYIDNLVLQVGANVAKLLDSTYSTLSTFSYEIENARPSDSFRNLVDELQKESDRHNFVKIALVDSYSTWYYGLTVAQYPKLKSDIKQAISSNTDVISDVFEFEKQNVMAFISPVRDTVVQGTHIVAVVALLDRSHINSMLTLNLLQSQGSSYIVSTEGEILVRPDDEFDVVKSTNIFDYIKYSQPHENELAKNVPLDFENGVSSSAHYSFNGFEYLATYSPIGFNDWFFVSIFPKVTLTIERSGFFYMTFAFFFVLFVIFLGLIVSIAIIREGGRKKLYAMAFKDALTNGPTVTALSRDVFKKVFDHPDYYLASFNVIRLKRLNDVLGRIFADEILRHIYRVFKANLTDDEFVARHLGDNFIVIFRAENINLAKKRLLSYSNKINAFELIKHNRVCMKLSCGVCKILQNEKDLYTIIDKANIARKKLDSGDIIDTLTIAVFDDALKEALRLNEEMEERQDAALQSGEFEVYLQPKYGACTEQIAGAEALVRWKREGEKMYFPDMFIPLFEKNGFISKLDLYVFEQVCIFQKRFKEEFGNRVFVISVNLSRVQLVKEDFIQKYFDISQKYDVETCLIEFEITETVFTDDLVVLTGIIDEIRSYGFRVAMDDFGTGYSSLNLLGAISLDVLKLDKGFLGVGTAIVGRNKMIIQTVIELAKKLGIEVVAEGVEDIKQLEVLRQFGCEYIQGFYFSKPKPMDELFIELCQINQNDARTAL